MSGSALRTALIWNDEVMEDVVLEQPAKITLGRIGKATFTVPEVGLPQGFAIMRPGNRGYLLTLGEKMGGTICIDGESKDVRDFVGRGDSSDPDLANGGFRATPISGGDWGVIDLDESGRYKLFFQFVKPESQPLNPNADFNLSLMRAGALAMLALLAIGVVASQIFENEFVNPFNHTRYTWIDVPVWAEWLYRSLFVIVAGVLVFSLVWWFIHAEPEQQASVVFAVLLMGAGLAWSWYTYTEENPYVWPGPRSMTGNYLVTRLEPDPPQPPPPPTVGKQAQKKADAAPENPDPKPKNTATKNDEGAAGGKGKERSKDPKAPDKPPAPKVGVLTAGNEKVIQGVRDLATNSSKFIKGMEHIDADTGKGTGTGTGVGNLIAGNGTTRGSKGKGTGGGGGVEGDYVSNKGAINTGGERPGGKCVGENCTGSGPKEVKLAIAGGTGDFGGYTEDEINRVVKARAGVFRACYQKELNRSPGLGGKLVMRWKIGADGAVVSVANAGSTLSNEAVESCVKSNIMRLKFPPKGAIANVTYPFVYSQGG